MQQAVFAGLEHPLDLLNKAVRVQHMVEDVAEDEVGAGVVERQVVHIALDHQRRG